MRKRSFLIVTIAIVLEFCSIVGFTSAGRAESEFWKGFFWYSWLAGITILMSYGGLKLNFRSLIVTSIALGFGMAATAELIDMTITPGLIGDEPMILENLPWFFWGAGIFIISGFISMCAIFLLKLILRITWTRLSTPRPQADLQ